MVHHEGRDFASLTCKKWAAGASESIKHLSLIKNIVMEISAD